MGRLNAEAGGGAWCPAQVVTNTSRPEWLMVDLGEAEVRVTGVIVQGRWDRGLGQEWAQEVRIQAWTPGAGGWVTQGAERRPGNTDTLTPVMMRLEPPAETRRIRVIPLSEHARTVCIRLELCGCNIEEEEEMIQTFEDVHDEVYDASEEIHVKPRVTSAPISTSDKHLGGYDPGYMSMVIAVLVSVILILTLVIIFILYNNNISASQQQTTTTTVPKYSYSEYQALPPADYASHYSNESNYSEYSRPLLGRLNINFSPNLFIISPSDIFPPFSSGLNISGPSSSVPPAPVSVMSGSSPAHKMLWDLSWPPPPLPSSAPGHGHGHPQYHHQVTQVITFLFSLTSETSNSEQFTTNTFHQGSSNYCKTCAGHTDKHTFFLFLGKPMVSPPGQCVFVVCW